MLPQIYATDLRAPKVHTYIHTCKGSRTILAMYLYYDTSFFHTLLFFQTIC